MGTKTLPTSEPKILTQQATRNTQQHCAKMTMISNQFQSEGGCRKATKQGIKTPQNCLNIKYKIIRN